MIGEITDAFVQGLMLGFTVSLVATFIAVVISLLDGRK